MSGRREGAGGRASEQASKQMECFFFGVGPPANRNMVFFLGVGPPENRNMVRQFDARQYVALTLYAVRGYVALTQHIAVRGYDTLTRGARGVV